MRLQTGVRTIPILGYLLGSGFPDAMRAVMITQIQLTE
jgi:hypothetical protein